ncbi:MAG: outer membrane protein assembly factor BamD [Ottowia sp.]|nr:outer membrane protein assembly factor BamD [Ottowia sp.]
MTPAQRFFRRYIFVTLRGFVLISATSIVMTACGNMGKTDETAGWSEDKLYSQAQEHMEGADYVKAVKYFETLESRYPFGQYAQQAQINIAYSNWKDGEHDAALAAVDRFIQLHPSHAYIDYAYYLKGMISFNDNLGWLGRFSGQDLSERDPTAARYAFDAFKVLVTRFPQSKYSADARMRMQYIVDSLAKHELHVAQFYLKQGAYLAAVNRAQQALKDSEGTPAMEDALIVMVRGYAAMNIQDLRDDSERVLKQSFPHSDYFSDPAYKKVKTKSWWQIWG